MRVDAQFDVALTEEEQEQTAKALGVAEAELSTKLTVVAEAATSEYVDMILGRAAYSRGSDLREHRLLTLIEKVFEGSIPDELTISRLFKCTRSQARTLLRGVMSRYDYRLGDSVRRNCIQAVRSMTEELDGNDYVATIRSSGVVDALNQYLSEEDGSLPRIRPKRGTHSVYIVKPSAYDKLKEILEVGDGEDIA